MPRVGLGRRLSALLLVGVGPGGVLVAQEGSTRDFRASVSQGLIVASQGRDESLHSIRIGIWGKLRDSSTFRTQHAQLDDDPEAEFLVVSRNEGSGPYYRLQIVVSRPAAIVSLSYPSCGSPRIEPPRIGLGECPGVGAAGTANPRYRWYRLSHLELVPE